MKRSVRIVVKDGKVVVDWDGFGGSPDCYKASANLIRGLAELGLEVNNAITTPKEENQLVAEAEPAAVAAG